MLKGTEIYCCTACFKLIFGPTGQLKREAATINVNAETVKKDTEFFSWLQHPFAFIVI